MISVFGLRKSFGNLHVLKGVDVSFPPGQVTALVGPNGSGKTTLIKAMLGLSRPDGGAIQVGDHHLNGDWRYRAAIGYMPQIPPFPENLSAAELFRMLRDLRNSDVGPDADAVELYLDHLLPPCFFII